MEDLRSIRGRRRTHPVAGTGDQAFISADHPAGFNRPTMVRFGPDDCAYVADYGAVRDNGEDTHFVGSGNGPLVQIPGTGVIWKICRQ